MKIKDILDQEKSTLSFEVFPPKAENKYESVKKAAVESTGSSPAPIDVTYGASRRISRYMVDITSMLSNTYQVPALTHLTCVSSTKSRVHQILEGLKERNLENVLALRRDIPKDGAVETDYRYASQLIYEIRQTGDFCVGAACYPGGHVGSVNRTADIGYLKEKVEADYGFVAIQMFFDNNILYNYFYRIRGWDITVPVMAGIMPVTSVAQIKRIYQMSGICLPTKFKAILDRFGDNPAAMKQVGIACVMEQTIDLIANSVNGIHVYSMNKLGVAKRIVDSLSEIL